MALVERVMGLNDDGTSPSESTSKKIGVLSFYAACAEVVTNYISISQAKIYLGLRSEIDDSGTSDTADFDALMAIIPTDAGAQALFLEHIKSTFLFAEVQFVGYSTPSNVRSKLGI